MLGIVCIVGLVFLFFLIKKTGGVANPVIMVFFYFYSLLALSQVSLTGLPVPEVKTSSYFLLAFVSASLGALLASARVNVSSDEVFYNNQRVLFLMVLFLGAIPLFYLLSESAKFILSSGYEAYVVRSRFAGDRAVIAGSSAMATIIDRVSRPLVMVATLVGTAMIFHKKPSGLFWLGILSLVVFSFLYVKRIDLMFVLVIYLAGLLASRTGRSGIREASRVKNYIVLGALGLIVVFISSFRSSSYNMYQLFLHYAVGYHSYGFALFDYALHNPLSHLHDVTYPGESVFATFDFVKVQFYKLFGIDYQSISSVLYADELGEHVFMGVNNFNGRDLDPNAFYTSLYPIYRDLKELGLVVFPFAYGYFFSREYLTYQANKNLRSLVWVVFCSWVGYASLLTPVIMGNTFWIIPLVIFIVFRVRLLSSKEKSCSS